MSNNYVGRWIVENKDLAVVEFSSNVSGYSYGYTLKPIGVGEDYDIIECIWDTNGKVTNKIKWQGWDLSERVGAERDERNSWFPEKYNAIAPTVPSFNVEDPKILQEVGKSIVTPIDLPPIYQLVISDMIQRAQHGIKKYGVPLQINNGRVALQDLYEELIDATQYIKQEIEERKIDSKKVLIKRFTGEEIYYFAHPSDREGFKEAWEEYWDNLASKINCTLDSYGIMELASTIISGEIVYDSYLKQFGGPFPVKWSDLSLSSQEGWNNIAKNIPFPNPNQI